MHETCCDAKFDFIFAPIRMFAFSTVVVSTASIIIVVVRGQMWFACYVAAAARWSEASSSSSSVTSCSTTIGAMWSIEKAPAYDNKFGQFIVEKDVDCSFCQRHCVSRSASSFVRRQTTNIKTASVYQLTAHCNSSLSKRKPARSQYWALNRRAISAKYWKESLQEKLSGKKRVRIWTVQNLIIPVNERKCRETIWPTLWQSSR